MKPILYVGAGAVGALGLAFAIRRSMLGSQTETINGWSVQGTCSHFDLHSPEHFYDDLQSGAPELDPVRLAIDTGDDLETVYTLFFRALFPQCQWPPPPSTTFGKDKLPWGAAVDVALGREAVRPSKGAGGTERIRTLMLNFITPR